MTDSLWKPDNGYFFWDIFSHQYLIVMKPNKFSDQYWYPTTMCSYNAQSLVLVKVSQEMLALYDSCTISFFFPNSPLDPPICLVIFILSFPSQFVTLNQD